MDSCIEISSDMKHFSCSTCYETFVSDKDLKCHLCSQSDLPNGIKSFELIKNETILSDYGNQSSDYNSYYENVLQREILQEYSNNNAESVKCETEEMLQELFTHSEILENSESIPIDKKPIECQFCHKLYSCVRSRNDHITRLHRGEKPFKCTVCDKAFTLNKILKNHLLTHSGEKPFECAICHKRFSRKDSLTAHRRLHTKDPSVISKKDLLDNFNINSADQPFKCILCFKSFPMKKRLTEHIKIHTGEKLFKCIFCHATFCSKYSYERHVEEHNLKHIKCEICCKYFASELSYIEHRKTHSTGKNLQCQPAECSVCHKILKRRHLRRHMQIHTGEKPFLCQICHKPFRTKSEVAIHLRIHTKERPFECPVCQKLFRVRPALLRHQKIHLGERPFKCEMCLLAFSQKAHLLRHMKKMHIDKAL